MNCCVCEKRIPEIFVNIRGNGTKRQLGFCVNCAFEHKLFTFSNIEENETVLESIRKLEAIEQKKDEHKATLCPVCGTSLFSFLDTRTAGCPECYSVFSEEFAQFKKLCSWQEDFSGSLPLHVADFHSILTDRVLLRQKLDEAVKSEQFEKAALYRDFLKALEKKSVPNGEENA